MADFGIRTMSRDDIDEVIELWRVTEGVGLRQRDDSPEAIGAFLGKNPGLSFVAMVDDRIAGALLCGCDGRRGYLHHLAVAKLHRRRGIARALVASATGALETMGITKTGIDVFSDNSDAVACWIALGFVKRPDIARMSLSHGDRAGSQ